MTLVSITIGRKPFDADSRVARIIYWLLTNQREIMADQIELTVSCGKQSIKYKVSRWHEDKSAESVA